MADATATCATRAADVLAPDGFVVGAARAVPGLRLLNFTDAFCDDSGMCPPVVGNVVTLRDPCHMTATFSKSLAPALQRRLKAALPGVL